MGRAPLALPLLALLLAAPAAAPAAEGEKAARRLPLDEVLEGGVTYDGTTLEVRYDLEDPEELRDFADYKPFHVEGPWKREWFDKSIHLSGTGGIVFKPILRRRVEMEFDARVRIPRDFGAFVAEDRASEHFTLFSVYDQFFQNKDSRGSPKVHMICRFLPEAADSGGEMAFRYVIRNPQPAVAANKTFHVKLGRQGADEFMEIDGHRMAGSESQWSALRGYRPGLYVLESEAWVSNLAVRGEVDPKWAEGAGVDLTIPVKARAASKAPRPPGPGDLAARDRIEAVRAGTDAPGSLLKYLEDGTLLEAVREEAAAALEQAGDVKLVPRLVALLESQDLLTRKLASKVVNRLSGKSWGFSPDGPEEGRRKAVRSLLDWIEKNPSKFK